MTREQFERLSLPDVPGVYQFIGPRGAILYIGKATSLRDRVKSYFTGRIAVERSPAIAAMVDAAKTIRWHTTESVLEALILEAHLIKTKQPPYNIDEKDNKSFNYLVITKEPYPRVLTIRGRELFDPLVKKDFLEKHVFGPFPQGGSLKEALKIIRKIFPYRDTCTPQTGKPCFNAQIGLCPGVCSGAIPQEEYQHTIRNITDLFRGNFHGLRHRLVREMQAAAGAKRYEEAATLRRQITALEHIRDVSLIKDDLRHAPGGATRIEAYDVAHTAGKETVGVMTVVVGGEPQRNQYRKFIIRTAKNNDTAALAEMLERRLAHTEWPYPRVMVIDGGTAQLNRARSVLRRAGVFIPLVGVIKDERHKPKKLIGDGKTIERHEPEILHANAEAHRFGINWHRMRLRKSSFA